MTSKSQKPILLIDMDGVFVDYYDHFSTIWKQKYPDRIWVKPEDLNHMYFENCYPEEYSEDILEITRGIGFFENLPPLPGAVEALKQILEDDEFDAFLCSTPDSDTVSHVGFTEKARSVEKHLGRDWLRKLILTHDKTMVQAHYLIDDKPNIKGIMDPSWDQIFFSHGYNQESRGLRLNNWAEWPELKKQILSTFGPLEEF